MRTEVPPVQQGHPSSFWQIQNQQEVVPHCPELAEVTRSTWIWHDIPIYTNYELFLQNGKNVVFWDHWTSDTNIFMLSQIKCVRACPAPPWALVSSHQEQPSPANYFQIASCIRVVRHFVILPASKFALQDFICVWFRFNSTYTTAFGLCKLLLSSSKSLHNCHAAPTQQAANQ